MRKRNPARRKDKHSKAAPKPYRDRSKYSPKGDEGSPAHRRALLAELAKEKP